MVCILCLSSSNNIIKIYDENGIGLGISEVITKHFWIQPNKEDASANSICCSCWNTVDSFHKFYTRVEEAHFNLGTVKAPIEDDASVSNDFDGCMDFVSADIKSETSEDATNEHPKFDPVLAVDQERTTAENDKTKPEIKYDSESDVPIVRLARLRQSTIDKYQQHVQYDKNDRGKHDKITSNKDLDYSPVPTPSGRKYKKDGLFKDKLAPCREFDKIIRQHMKLSCDICHTPLTNFSALKDHYEVVHKQLGYALCCDKKFESRHGLAHHIMLHKNPDCFKCGKCGRVLANKRGYKRHMNFHTVREMNNANRVYKCERCDQTFSKQKSLDSHMKRHFRRTKICEQCGKETTGLKQHVLRMHTNYIRQRVNCPKCGIDLADACTLHTHMKYQHPKEPDAVYKCNICGKISTSGYGLKRHIQYMHKFERRHKCDICEKGFKLRKSLRAVGAWYPAPFGGASP